jgi:hypothetical protein
LRAAAVYWYFHPFSMIFGFDPPANVKLRAVLTISSQYFCASAWLGFLVQRTDPI